VNKNYYCKLESEETSIFYQLFKPFVTMVENSGGDGDGTIWCKYFYYKDVANLFEQYLKDNIKIRTYARRDMDDLNMICFGCHQEGFSIRQLPQLDVKNLPQQVELNFEDIVIVI
jgi:hypothetical protein